MKTITPSPLLKFAFLADACVSAAVALLQLGLSAWLASLLALPASLLLGTGAFLACYAALLVALAYSRAVWRPLVQMVIFGNACWCAACLALMAGDAFQPGPLGVAFLVVQAATVVLFALLQAAGLARSAAAPVARSVAA